MPEAADSTRKRSRSPSDSDQQQKHHKRANTGAPTDGQRARSLSATPPPANTATGDVAMTDGHAANDTNASTPSPRGSQSDLPTNADSEDSKGGPPSAHIHMRCLIVTQDASIIIGRNGAHVNEIRDKSNARVMVSESIPGNPERILNVSGPLDAVSKVRQNH